MRSFSSLFETRGFTRVVSREYFSNTANKTAVEQYNYRAKVWNRFFLSFFLFFLFLFLIYAVRMRLCLYNYVTIGLDRNRSSMKL